jgi:PLP dependent protein
VPAERVLEACRGGIRLVGENRVQEAESKIAALASFPEAQDLTWHLIGHLQSNKAKKAANLFNAVQSLDGAALAEKLDAEAAKLGKVLSCLAEVKVSDEPTKFGLAPEALDEFLGRAAEFRHLSIEGLMTVAPYFDDPEKARPFFRRMRELFEAHSSRFKGRKVLSMGMSHDFEVAVEEGSTLVRIGTALFGPRPQKG